MVTDDNVEGASEDSDGDSWRSTVGNQKKAGTVLTERVATSGRTILCVYVVYGTARFVASGGLLEAD